MNEPKVTIGLYRHFKGEYYFVQNIVKDAVRDIAMCQYFNVSHTEYGIFVRPVDEWFSEDTEKGKIIDRLDNKTGQKYRFEKVRNLNFQLGSVSTEQLIKELRNRVDSPIHELDIEGLQSKIFAKDYIVGEACEQTEDTPQGVYTIASFNDEDSASMYYYSHLHNKKTKVFKRVFIEV